MGCIRKNTIEQRKDIIKIKTLAEYRKQIVNHYNYICDFKCSRLPSLQKYIIDDADQDETNHIAKTYIVYDAEELLIIAYFSIRATSMVHDIEEIDDEKKYDGKLVRSVVPCVEIEKFALNDNYLDWLEKNEYTNIGIGKFVFQMFISPILLFLSDAVAFHYVILFACNNEKVISAYRDMNFETVGDDGDMIIIASDNTATPFIDLFSKECRFMYQELNEVIRHIEGGC